MPLHRLVRKARGAVVGLTARHARLASALAVVAVAFGCAPKAKLIDGPVSEEVTRGVQQGTATFDHSELDALLVAHVDAGAGRVDYEALASERPRLDAYLGRVAAATLPSLSAPELEALLINAYNAYTISLMLDHLGEVTSIREIDDPWGAKRYTFGGHTVSLDDLEHGLLRPIFKDPRVHFAVNCASIGCPPLRAGAYTGVEVDAQLEAATRRTLSDERYARWEGGALALTRIMNWYGEDFTREGWSPRSGSVAGFVKRYARADLAAKLEEGTSVTWLEYDWAANTSR